MPTGNIVLAMSPPLPPSTVGLLLKMQLLMSEQQSYNNESSNFITTDSTRVSGHICIGRYDLCLQWSDQNSGSKGTFAL